MLKLVLPEPFFSLWKEAIQKIDPNIPLALNDDEATDQLVTFAVAWKQKPNELARFPNIQVVSAPGAGVDYLLEDTALLPQVKIVRIVDSSLSDALAEYALLAIANRRREWLKMLANQQAKIWQRDFYPPVANSKVGVLGLGPIGQVIAQKLHVVGYQVKAWNRSYKILPDIPTFAGHSALPQFLSELDFLVCILPQNDETKNILNKELFNLLPNTAYLINIGRGGLLNEQDLLQALANNQLDGACLDVFATEPLPPTHPFWTHPKILVTPHIGSMAWPELMAPHVIENYHRFQKGEPLLNQVR